MYDIFIVCVCILALVIQEAKRMCHVILSSLASLIQPFFSHIRPNFTNRTILGNKIEYSICIWFLLQHLSERFLNKRKIRDKFHKCTQVFIQSAAILIRFEFHLNFFAQFGKILTHRM